MNKLPQDSSLSEQNSSSSRVEETADDERDLLTMERRMKIVEELNTRTTASVTELQELLGASPATIRRDLNWLDKQGLIARTRGGAMAIGHAQAMPRRTAPSYEQRLREHIEEKRAIGQCAAEQVQDEETIILDNGSTHHYMIPFLARKQNLTVITNSLYLINELTTITDTNPTLTVILTGGIFYGRSRSFIGMTAEQALSQFFVDKAFLGVRGISTMHGLTSPLLEEIPIKRQMMKCAAQVFVLADSSKFERTFAGLIAPVSAAAAIITDDRLAPDIAQQFRYAGPQLILAPLATENSCQELS